MASEAELVTVDEKQELTSVHEHFSNEHVWPRFERKDEKRQVFATPLSSKDHLNPSWESDNCFTFYVSPFLLAPNRSLQQQIQLKLYRKSSTRGNPDSPPEFESIACSSTSVRSLHMLHWAKKAHDEIVLPFGAPTRPPPQPARHAPSCAPSAAPVRCFLVATLSFEGRDAWRADADVEALKCALKKGDEGVKSDEVQSGGSLAARGFAE